jgi:hypothetical protein
MYCYDELPEYRKVEGQMVSYDDTYVYDVKVPATCMSRRFLSQDFALQHNLLLKPLKAYGKYVAHPYSTHFSSHDWQVYESVIVQQSHAMSKNAIDENVKLHHKGPLEEVAVAFVLGDMTGTTLSPLESFGTYLPVPLYTDITCGQWYYPDIRHLKDKKAMVFGSIQEMKTHLHLLIYVMVPFLQSIAFMPFELNEKQAVLEYDSTMFDGLERPDLKTANDTSMALTLVRGMFETNEKLKFSEIVEKQPHIRSHVLHDALMRAPELRVMRVGDQRNSDVWTRDLIYFGGLNDGYYGLSSYTDSATLKRDILSGIIKFKDKKGVNTYNQQLFLANQGFELMKSRWSKEKVDENDKTISLTFRPYEV